MSQSTLADYGEAPGIICLQYKGYVRCLQGHPAEGLELLKQAAGQARELRHPLSLAFTLFIQSLAQLTVLDFQQCRETALECSTLSSEHKLVFWIAGSQVMLGCATTHLGDPGGLAMARQALKDWQGTAAALIVPVSADLIADASLASGTDLDEVEMTVEDALKISEATHELMVVSDLLRLRGEIGARRGDPERARRSFEAAIATAGKQGAHLFGLRAATSLAGLLVDQGMRNEAERVLAPLVSRFSQGEQFPDLRRARSLLGASAA
jgi:hypothetical protein